MSWSEGPGEKKEERKKKKKALLVGETASTSQECPSRSDKGQETTTAMSVAGRTISIKHIDKGDKSMRTKKMDDESRQEKEIDVEEQGEVDIEERGKTTDEPEAEFTNDNDEPEDEPTMVEFEDPVYELSQTYEMESEYESMTVEQEATEVRALSPAGASKVQRIDQATPTTSRNREKNDWSVQNDQRKNQSTDPWSADRSNKKKCTSGAYRETRTPSNDGETENPDPNQAG